MPRGGARSGMRRCTARVVARARVRLSGWSAVCVALALAAPMPAAASSPRGGLDAVLQGMTHLQRGELDTAYRELSAAVAADSTDAFALLQMGIVQARRGDFAGASASFRRSHNLDPREPWGPLWLCILALRGRELEEAETWCREALRNDAFNSDAHYFLGAISLLKGDLSGAVQNLTRARDANSDDPETHFRLACAYHSLGMWASAELEYRRTLEIDSRHIQALCQLGWLQYNRNRREEAKASWQRALQIAPGCIDASLSLSQAYDEEGRGLLDAGDVGGALSNWKKALAYNPSNRAAKYYIQKYSKD